MDQVEARAIKNDEYIAKVSSELENIKKVLADIDARLLSVEERLARVSLSKEDMERIQMDISKLSKRIETVESRVSFLEKTAIGRGGAGRAEQEGVKANQPSLSREEVEKRISNARDLIVNGNYDEAIKILNGVFASGYDSVELRFLMGDAFFRKGEYKTAISHWVSIIDRENELKNNKDLSYIIPRTYLRLAHAFMRIGDDKNADIMLRAINLKYPESPEAKTANELLKNMKDQKR